MTRAKCGLLAVPSTVPILHCVFRTLCRLVLESIAKSSHIEASVLCKPLRVVIMKLLLVFRA